MIINNKNTSVFIQNYTNSVLKERIIPNIITQQKKIVIIASFVLCIFACLMVRAAKSFFNRKITLLEPSKVNQEPAQPLPPRKVDIRKEKPEMNPKIDSPKVLPLVDEPKKDAAQTEEPKANGRETKRPRIEVNVEEPKDSNENPRIVESVMNQADEPKQEVIKRDEPKTEVAKVDTPMKVDTPKIDATKNQPRKTDLPKVEEPKDSGTQVKRVNIIVTPVDMPKEETSKTGEQPKAEVNKVNSEADKIDIKTQNFLKLAQKNELFIISAQEHPYPKKLIKEVTKLNMNSGFYGFIDKLEKELKGDQNYQTFLAIKDQKIVGFFNGEIQKSAEIEETGIKADRFYLHHYRIHPDFCTDKNQKEKIEAKLMLDFIKKIKDLTLPFFSYKYCHHIVDDYGNGKLTPEHKFYMNFEALLSKCTGIYYERLKKCEEEGEVEFWKHKSYDIQKLTQ